MMGQPGLTVTHGIVKCKLMKVQNHKYVCINKYMYTDYNIYIYMYVCVNVIYNNIDPGKPAAEVSQT